MRSNPLSILCIALIAGLGLSVLPAAAEHCEIELAGSCDSCTIDLVNGFHTCVPDLAPSVNLSGNQAVVQVAPLDGSSPFGWRRAIFDIQYQSQPVPGEWTVNIGDSRSNNGYGGDGTHQSRDSELQIVAEDLTVWADDHVNTGASCPTCVPAGHTKKTLELCDLIDDPEKTLSLEVTNNQMRWNAEPGKCDRDGTLRSPFIYSLDGQADFEGPVNGDIFAAFNRTIQFHPNRVGKAVAMVEMTLCTQ
ncbi:MAG: hypothetical protein AAF657_39290 [Acidobacteriota bacterium]